MLLCIPIFSKNNSTFLKPLNIEAQQTIRIIPQELDLGDWNLEFDQGDIQVYSRFNASNSGIIGFKTVSYHAVRIESVVHLLKDVCDAMNSINDMFVLGEVFRKWPTHFDPEGTLVRSSFKMPFPFKNREFLHGLHHQKINETTHIIAYTPIEEVQIPVQSAYIRCQMFISGQRLSHLENGTVKVEHLMVYRLGGRVSDYIQDQWLKRLHVNAYIKEWRNLRGFLFPPKLEDLDYENLLTLGKDSFEKSKKWDQFRKGRQGQVKVGRLSYAPRTAFRLDIEVDATINKAVDVLADRSLAFLPRWNKEFIEGEILETTIHNDQKTTWVVRVHYATPKPLDNRSYIYFFSREWITEDEALICYNSIDYFTSTPEGFTRALLYPSFHRCLRLDKNRTKIEHILATDLGGNLSKFQDNLLKGSLAAAQYKDMEKQVVLFEGL